MAAGSTGKRNIVTVYVARHGESLENRWNDEQTREIFSSNGLTHLGKLQASCLGKHLEEVSFSRIYSSDYPRAVETAEIVHNCNKRRPQEKVEATTELREINFGSLQGASYVDLALHTAQSSQDPYHLIFPNGESGKNCGERMLNFLLKVYNGLLASEKNLSGNEDLNVLLISHSVSITTLFYYLSYDTSSHSHAMANWKAETDLKFLKNAAFYKVQIADNFNTAPNGGPNSDFLPLRFTFLEKFYSDHLAGINDEIIMAKFDNSETNRRQQAVPVTRSVLGRDKVTQIFSKHENANVKKIAGCIQQ